MEAIKAVLFEPVGCLAEFRADEFDAAADALGAPAPATPGGGSQAYWRLTGLIEQEPERFAAAGAHLAELELRAVERADLYPDVVPCLTELRELGIATILTSSLSRAAVDRFAGRFSLSALFAGAVARDEAGGVRAKVLRYALERVPLDPPRIMALVDTAESLELAKQQGLSAMLMINDYDEGRALATLNPAGGIVSLAELPDALRVIEQQSGLRQTSRPPRGPYELFEPT